MNRQEKDQKILEIRGQKELLRPALLEAFQEKNVAYKIYLDLNYKWTDLKQKFEDLDREEKLIFFSIPENKTKVNKKMPKDRVKEAQEHARKLAMKSLESLPPEIRAQVMANFNQEETKNVQ